MKNLRNAFANLATSAACLARKAVNSSVVGANPQSLISKPSSDHIPNTFHPETKKKKQEEAG